MTVKFKVGFTIDGETLFTMIAKMLPIEDLSVRELPVLRIEPTSKPKLISDHKPKPKQQIHKRASRGPNLTKGINAILIAELSTGSKRALDLQGPVKAVGFSPNSVNSRLEELRRAGAVVRIGDGRWRLKDAGSHA